MAVAACPMSCALLLKATRGITIPVVSSRERKRRQPGLSTDDPELVGWLQLVRGIQASQIHPDFIGGACENGRAAAGTEGPPGVVACFTLDRHGVLRKYRGSVEKGPVVLAAIETVANADPVRASRRFNSHVATSTATRESGHLFGHRITSSARCSSDCGIVIPSAIEVLRLIASSNVVGCSTGISAGFVPRRILSTNLAALRQCHASDET